MMLKTWLAPIVALSLALFSSVTMAELSVYWTTDGIDPSKVRVAASKFSQALDKELGVSSTINVVDSQIASNAFLQKKVDLLVTCNEVDSHHVVPLGSLSNQPVSSLDCRGGMMDQRWALAVDHSVERRETGEIWVYMMRDSDTIARAREARDVMDAVKKQVEVDLITTAKAF